MKTQRGVKMRRGIKIGTRMKMRRDTRTHGEEGQEIVLFGVMLAVVIAAGAVLAVDLVWLRAGWTALQEASLSAAAAGTVEVAGLPGARALDADRAEEAARRVLEVNLAALPFLDLAPGDVAVGADVHVVNPPAATCEPDPLGGPCHDAPFVSIGVEAPIRLPWGNWQLTLYCRAVAEAGESPQ